eukprot:gnl/Chilomastix_cuspidata/4789.p1 GENE.gnl/Chilomastix_cuspidata/4789~~gnl/Chilomastix_cuspidata/4789.p1  ORF type:complete len:410 (+),score=179.05 gnl/Chilomastix_cuspidata/4789:35-1264(+)
MNQLQPLLVDNGAFNIKGGLVDSKDPVIIPNLILKQGEKEVIGNDILTLSSTSGMQIIRTTDKGYPTRWPVQIHTWIKLFQNLKISSYESCVLVLAIPPFMPQKLKTDLAEVVFEYFGFGGLFLESPAFFAARSPALRGSPVSVVVDSGHAATWVTPVVHSVPVLTAIRRVDVAGNVLTNLLRSAITRTQINAMADTLLIARVKPLVLRVPGNLARELERLKRLRPLTLEASYKESEDAARAPFVLFPNQTTIKEPRTVRPSLIHLPQNEGLIKAGVDVYKPGPEVLTISEALFNPIDIGVSQAGVGDTVVDVVQQLPPPVQRLALQNIVLCGGTSNIPGFAKRLEKEVRSFADSDFPVRVLSGAAALGADPTALTFRGMQEFVASEDFQTSIITARMFRESRGLLLKY